MDFDIFDGGNFQSLTGGGDNSKLKLVFIIVITILVIFVYLTRYSPWKIMIQSYLPSWLRTDEFTTGASDVD